MKLTFDEVIHAYKLGERRLPSVTEIIKDVGLMGDLTKFGSDYAMTRGSYVHKACEFLDAGDLDESALDPAIVGYVEAYKKFRAECPMTWTAVEVPLCDAALGFAGTPDRVGDRLVVDLKTGTKQAWHGPQLAAYTMLALVAPLNTTIKRYGLYLSKEGTYKLEQYKERRDFDVFRAALLIYNTKRGN